MRVRRVVVSTPGTDHSLPPLNLSLVQRSILEEKGALYLKLEERVKRCTC
jgi:hypothetical protein